MIAFKALYTKQKTQKSKKWQDGLIKFNKETNKVFVSKPSSLCQVDAVQR
jgi:uncharacterized membrane protein